ncbi:hypothetical protein [Brochothrix thermosphacta]|uniref:hypothetical protein n=1 Tax=Brochothrix thermosphacta TaxID=2756 RepID=UPI00265CA183|nr:hypothetical protein [Brochothrix thermosphacta]WKK68286.1 hypothetical protein Q0G00_08150 [Brochothrix thermosphacta]
MNEETAEIRALLKNGEQYYPQTHIEAVVGLESLNINDFGVFFVSPNGKKWQLIVDNEGKLSTLEVSEGVN